MAAGAQMPGEPESATKFATRNFLRSPLRFGRLPASVPSADTNPRWAKPSKACHGIGGDATGMHSAIESNSLPHHFPDQRHTGRRPVHSEIF
jgi:hypothetical protein